MRNHSANASFIAHCVVLRYVRRKRPTMYRMAHLIIFMTTILVSCSGSVPHATYDNRHFYLNARPWTPVFEIVDSISAITVFLTEELVVEGRVEMKTFYHAGAYCNLTLWRYPIDTTVTKSTGDGLVLGAPSVPGIVTQIGYAFHSDSLHRGAKIDSIGKFIVPMAEGTYLIILTVGGYNPVVVKDLDVRVLHHSILNVTLQEVGVFIY